MNLTRNGPVFVSRRSAPQTVYSTKDYVVLGTGFATVLFKHVRKPALDYCHRDALAMVRLVETLEGLARVAP
jgi:hypothetical protein